MITIDNIRQAKQLALSDASLPAHDVLFGCAMPDFRPVIVSLPVLASLFRWQYVTLWGNWDEQAFNAEFPAYRRKVSIA